MVALNNDDMVTVTGVCVMCKKPQNVVVRAEDLDRWKAGDGYVQTIFNYLSAGDREFLISQICSTCLDTAFPKEEDDENEEV